MGRILMMSMISLHYNVSAEAKRSTAWKPFLSVAISLHFPRCLRIWKLILKLINHGDV